MPRWLAAGQLFYTNRARAQALNCKSIFDMDVIKVDELFIRKLVCTESHDG